MASSCSSSSKEQATHPKRRLLRQSSRAMQTPEHSEQIEVAIADDCLRNERARRLAQAFDSPMGEVYQGSKVQEIHQVRRDPDAYQHAGLLLAISSPRHFAGDRRSSGSSELSPAASSSDPGLPPVQEHQGFTPWSCTGPDYSGPCQACLDAAHFFQRQHCQLAELFDSDLSTTPFSSDVDQSSTFSWEDYDDIEP